ncbi:hypothetical protein GCM10017774_13210 [Lentzea cavernae]|uniref:CheB-type methylesterase domain-containing protein n=1 Tax=Lentzea cavernae TaxID=2020703 RepID=A0ABQ3M3N9_9PSEU|nr:hypothetical protein GCM10017774_13210 [Lentzea cavernae]
MVLSRSLDDGTTGMVAIKNRAGTSLAQSRDDALHPGIPQNVLEHVAVDQIAPVSQLGALIAEDVLDDVDVVVTVAPESLSVEVEVFGDDGGAAFAVIPELGRETTLTCPGCSGSLPEISVGIGDHRGPVGHAGTPNALLDSYSGGLERAMWAAVRALEQKITLARRMATDARASSHSIIADRYTRKGEEALAAAGVLRMQLLQSYLRERNSS